MYWYCPRQIHRGISNGANVWLIILCSQHNHCDWAAAKVLALSARPCLTRIRHSSHFIAHSVCLWCWFTSARAIRGISESARVWHIIKFDTRARGHSEWGDDMWDWCATINQIFAALPITIAFAVELPFYAQFRILITYSTRFRRTALDWYATVSLLCPRSLCCSSLVCECVNPILRLRAPKQIYTKYGRTEHKHNFICICNEHALNYVEYKLAATPARPPPTHAGSSSGSSRDTKHHIQKTYCG